MPTQIKSGCKVQGCPKRSVNRNRECEDHQTDQRRELDSHRPSAAKRGYGPRWRRARAAYLRSNPLCRACEARDRVTAATVVDHIVPHRGDQELFWNEENWQPLCKPDHDIKTAKGQ